MSDLDGRHIRGDRRREKVLAAARKLFIRNGYRNTSLDAIIALAGGSRDTIYRSLGGKRGLVNAIIADVADQLAVTIQNSTVAHLPPRQALTLIATQVLDIWRSAEGRAIHRMVVSEGLDSPGLIQAWFAGGPKPTLQALTDYFSEQNRDNQLTVPDPALAARQFLVLLMGETAFPMISGAEEPLEPTSAVDRTVDLILRAYSVDKGKPLCGREPSKNII